MLGTSLPGPALHGRMRPEKGVSVTTSMSEWVKEFGRLREGLTTTPMGPQPDKVLAWQLGGLLAAGQISPFEPNSALNLLEPGQADNMEQMGENPSLLLFARYFLQITALQADKASTATIQSVLGPLSQRLEQTARGWAADGVNPTEREELISELRELAEYLRGKAA